FTNPILAALTTLDILFLAFLGWSLFKLCALAFMSHTILIYVFKSTFVDLNSQFEQILAQLSKQSGLSSACPLKAIHSLHRLGREHARITRYIFDADDQFWSVGSFIMFFTNIPINVYFVTYLRFRSVELSVKAVIFGILWLQTCSIIMTLLSTADV